MTPVDTALSNTGGVEPVIPISGLIMVLSGAGCLLVERRRAGSGSAPAAGAGGAPAADDVVPALDEFPRPFLIIVGRE